MKLTFGQLFDFGTWTAQIWLLHQSVRSEKKIQKFRSNFQRILFSRQSCFRRSTFSRNNSLSKYCLFTGPHLGSGYSKIEFWPMIKSFSILLFDIQKANLNTEFWQFGIVASRSSQTVISYSYARPSFHNQQRVRKFYLARTSIYWIQLFVRNILR